MGSFNKIGYISGLPIHSGDDVVLVFMKNKSTSSTLRGVIYPTDWFAPAFLPVYGVYDDYGKIKNVIGNSNVEYIEKFFNDKIDSIIEIIDDASVGRHSDEKLDAKYNDFTFGLEQRSVYNFMCNRTRPSYVEGHLTTYWLDKLGFTKSDTPTKDARYKDEWTHSSLTGGYTIHSDGTWSHLMKNGVQDRTHDIYHPNSLEVALEVVTNGQYKSILTDEDKKLCMYDLTVELTKESFKSNEDDEDLSDFKDEAAMLIMRDILRRTRAGADTYKGMYLLNRHLTEAYLDGKQPANYGNISEFLEKVDSKLIAEFCRFYSTVSSLNAKYCPSNYGNQDQDLRLHYDINKVYRKVIINKVKEYNEYTDEEDTVMVDILSDDRDESIEMITG